MTRIITEQELVDAVHKVLEKRGATFVYGSEYGNECTYAVPDPEDGYPSGPEAVSSCLWGGVFIDELGLPYSPEWESHTLGQLLRNQDEMFGPDVRFEVSEKFIVVAHASQSDQDEGVPYGKVIDRFDERLKTGELDD